MLISSADLLGTCEIAARRAASEISRAREEMSPEIVASLTECEDSLICAVAELRAARWGITRRDPQFNAQYLEILLGAEQKALRNAHAQIPAR